MGLVGLCIGSFLNVVVHRMPLALERGWKQDSAELLGIEVDLPEPVTLSRPASRCPSCGHAIRWYENIPVVSYLALRGRCSACKTGISLRYPLIEIATALLFAGVAWRFGEHPVAWLWAGFTAVLVALAGIDWDTTLLPDNLTLPLCGPASSPAPSAGRCRCRSRCGARWRVTSRSGRCTGCSSS